VREGVREPLGASVGVLVPVSVSDGVPVPVDDPEAVDEPVAVTVGVRLGVAPLLRDFVAVPLRVPLRVRVELAVSGVRLCARRG